MHWLWTLWFGYTWPSLKGNGPEAVVQTIVYAAAAYLLIPPVRHWAEAHVKAIHDKLDHHNQAQMAQAKRHHDESIRQAEEHQVATHELLKKQHAERMTTKVTPIRKKPNA